MEGFNPRLLKEEPPPPFAVQCQKCELSNHRERVIWGEGNPSAKIFILLDNPGMREDAEGNPFVCGTRETLQRGILDAGMELDNVYISYLLKCRPKRAYNKPLARDACFSHFQHQLAEKNPRLLLGLGNTVVETLFPHSDADVKSLRGRWHIFEDIPVAFSYHPLAIRRRPVLHKYFIEDLKLLAQEALKYGLIEN
ncbi:uracil-DNA glycosylase [Paenibacillus sp. GCM10027626]|uniref:uracil-DNA glycosylase n=1 Tax=Paenibacillus sp. GCM10027626 TaxID=3273411 RepID=UPI0036407AA1